MLDINCLHHCNGFYRRWQQPCWCAEITGPGSGSQPDRLSWSGSALDVDLLEPLQPMSVDSLVVNEGRRLEEEACECHAAEDAFRRH